MRIVRAFLVLILIGVAAVVLLNFWPGMRNPERGASPSAGTTGTIDTERVRERAAEIGEKTAVATKKLQENLAEAGLTTKIKAKMALDDTLKSRAIDVSTEGSTVTVSGKVPSVAAHDRALALARETNGVSLVIDHLEIPPGS